MEVEKKVYRIAEFCVAYGISKSKAYLEIADGRLKAFKLGRSTMIDALEARAWIERCQEQSAELPKLAVGLRR